MKSRALRVSVCCATMGFLAAGCSSSGSGKSNPDGSGLEAGNPIDTSFAGKDVRVPGRDVVIRVDGPSADSPVEPSLDGPTIAPTPDVPSVVPTPDAPNIVPIPDGADAEPPRDVPLGIEGGTTGIDAPRGEAGSWVPLIDIDGGIYCGQAGAVCQSSAECCGLACVSNRCAATACHSDGTDCTVSGECCSTVCGDDGTCQSLNPLCKTAGNTCGTGMECCSGVCDDENRCAQPNQVSYCAQVGDICLADSQCCTGICNAEPGAAAGTCATITTSCQIDGTVCAGCGVCCSHFCGPFGAADGPHICQPASGCHVQGDLCRKDSDCCGGDATSGLPGAGLVRCEPDPLYGGRIGICGGPKAGNCPAGLDTCKNSCNPEGNVCHYKDTVVCEGSTTSKRNDCCDCISGKDCCQLDHVGIPRCNSLEACVPSGGNCSFSGECCDNLPCVPDPVTGKLTCGSTCVPLGGSCTTNADCCTGMLCEVTPGSLSGVCIIPAPPPPPPPPEVPDGAVIEPDSAVIEPDATVIEPDAPPPPICGYFGQACSPSVSCCSGLSCVNNSFFACTVGDPSCFCFTGE